jgi:hypothetical protein
MRNDERCVDDAPPTGLFTRPIAIGVGPEPMGDEDQLFGANEVARHLNIRRSWVYHSGEARLLVPRRQIPNRMPDFVQMDEVTEAVSRDHGARTLDDHRAVEAISSLLGDLVEDVAAAEDRGIA